MLDVSVGIEYASEDPVTLGHFRKEISQCMFHIFQKGGCITVAVAIHAWAPIIEDDLETGMQIHLQ